MRIQNEINPLNSEYNNRKAYNSKLRMLSQTKSKNWPDSFEMKKKNTFEFEKRHFLEEEERRRRIDLEEKLLFFVTIFITISMLDFLYNVMQFIFCI